LAVDNILISLLCIPVKLRCLYHWMLAQASCRLWAISCWYVSFCCLLLEVLSRLENVKECQLLTWSLYERNTCQAKVLDVALRTWEDSWTAALYNLGSASWLAL